MAKERQIGNMTVNDGRGLLDNEGLCDSLIENLNNLLKNMAAGQYIRVCSITMEMVQKLQNLKKGIGTSQKTLEDQIEDLKRLNNELAEKAFNNQENAEE